MLQLANINSVFLAFSLLLKLKGETKFVGNKIEKNKNLHKTKDNLAHIRTFQLIKKF